MSSNWTVNETAECNESAVFVDESWLESQMYAGHIIDRTITPIWYFIGLTGNVLSAIIWLRRRMRRNNSSAVYLAALSINDTLFLLLHILQELKYAWNLRTVDFPVICELYAFIFLVTQYLAPMLVLAFTVERFIAVCFPYQKIHICTTSRAILASIGIVIGCLLLGSMQLYLWSYDADRKVCTARRSATAGGSKSLFSIWSWITEMLVFLVVPLIILIVNILVMREICRISNSGVELAINSNRLKLSKSASTNAMLLSVSFYVIFSTLPATIVYVLSTAIVRGETIDYTTCQPVDMANDPTWQQYVTFFTVRKIIEEICMSHYACNFLLFSITGREFRKEFCRTLRCTTESRSGRRRSSYENGTDYTMTERVGGGHADDELNNFVTATR